MSNLSKQNFYLQCIADAVAILISYTIAFWWRFRGPFGERFLFLFPQTQGHYQQGTYTVLLPGIVISYIIVAYLVLSKENLIRRSFPEELISVTRTVVMVTFIVLIYLFFSRSSINYSRGFVAVFSVLFWAICLSLRVVLKKNIMPMIHEGKGTEQIIVIGSLAMIKKRLARINDSRDWRSKVVGLIVTDQDMKGEYVDEIEVIANHSETEETIKTTSVDSIVIVPDEIDDSIQNWAKFFNDLGKTVHVDFSKYNLIPYATHTLDRVGSCEALSFHPTAKISRRRLFVKRILDIILSIILLPLLLLFCVLSFVFLNLESRGPVLLKRVRVGKNGRRFDQYRFRIFRMDAARRIKNGKNPMCIWGRFLSFSHLDRLPLLFNVLLSDMSIVGPHAPRLSRFLEYSPRRRSNLSIRPGIVGRWSFELDEEVIIKEERKYLEGWSFTDDALIVIEFLTRYVGRQLVRGYDSEQSEEEIAVIRDYLKSKKPLVYDRSKYTAKTGNSVLIYHIAKRTIDILLSILALVLLSPVFVILIILVISDDGGAPFYSHERIGKNGKRIHVYKFRSMRRDAGDLEKLLTPEQLLQYKNEFKIDDDPRITKAGEFLRKSSLDELPQLFNILKGELSIVGPRPIVESETAVYGDDIAKFLSVKPGLTGYWQAYARNNATYETGERQEMEMNYVDHASLLLDTKIFFKTFSSVAKGSGAQ